MPPESTTQYSRPECPSCGRLSPVGARFCSHCGQPLEAGEAEDSTGALPGESLSEPSEDDDAGAIAGAETGSAMLVVRSGPDQGAQFRLDKDLVSVGRSAESDVFLDDITVSRSHAEFLHGTEGWVLRDLGSLNGTYVNGDRIDQYRLRSGDQVQLGKYRFVFVDGGGAG